MGVSTTPDKGISSKAKPET